LNPDFTNVGQALPQNRLQIRGLNFADGSRVLWKVPGEPGAGRPLPIESVSPDTISVVVTPDFFTVGIEAQVIVTSPQPCGGQDVIEFLILNPAPGIASVTPNQTNVATDGASATITVTGNNFVTNSKVLLGDSFLDVNTTYVSPTQLTATILGSNLTLARASNIKVLNPTVTSIKRGEVGGGITNALPYTVNNLVPTLTTLSPTSRLATDTGFTLTVNGTNFAPGSTIKWNGAAVATTLVNPTQPTGYATQATANVSAAAIATAGTVNVTVSNPAPGGGDSNALTFQIQPPPLAPVITSVSPGFAFTGGQQFTLTVNGQNFANNSVVRWSSDGQTFGDRVTSFGSSTQLTATIPATDVASQGTANIRVFTPAPGGGTSNTVPFFIGAQFVTVSAATFKLGDLAPDMIVAGFGGGLATQTALPPPQTQPLQPLPKILAGTKVKVRDSKGMERDAGLFYVSGAQVNYQVPPGTEDGAAVAVATSSDGKISVCGLNIVRISPGVFSANQNGEGVPSAYILRVKPDNTRINEPILRFDSAQGKFVTVPYDMGPTGDNLFLVLFGTGFTNRSTAPEMGASATIGGTGVQVTFAGQQSEFIGLNQANLLLPRNLTKGAEVDVILTVEGKVANTLKVAFKP